MAEPNLIYVADPMCSWCWGFSPVIGAITERFGEALPIRLIMGGLRPGTTKPLDEAGKRTIREHWEHVHEASGQPFDMQFFERDGFVYDTEPASKAVVVAGRSAMEKGLACLRLVHAAFYAENRDVTNADVLANLAAEIGLDREEFVKALRSEEAKKETWANFAIAQRAGITGFPTLLAGLGDGAEYAIVTQGYQPADRIVPVLERWLQGL
ncbi:MAG: DsbA family protein [Pseudomonadota bacterium]|nr:DsbA family protein [Pseudomonadota bacterium]